MIFYKAWRESGTRFLLSVLTLAVLCAILVWFADEIRAVQSPRPTYDAYVWRSVYKGYLRELYLVLLLFLGAGGLLSERDQGSAGHTLALPVSRLQHLTARATVGLVQLTLLAALPALIIPFMSSLTSHHYAPLQAWQFAVLWAACGAPIFAVSFLCSAIFEGDYTAPVVALVALIAYSLIAEIPAIERHLPDLHDVMSGEGMHYFSAATSRLIGPFPWAPIVTMGLAALAVMATAIPATAHRDF